MNVDITIKHKVIACYHMNIVNNLLILDSNDWKNYYRVINSIFFNNCHTSAREKCYEEWNENLFSEQDFWTRKTLYAHLYYGAVDCAVKTLSSVIFTVSTYSLVLALSLIFI